MDLLPFEVRLELEGWSLFWALLELRPGFDAALDDFVQSVVRSLKSEQRLQSLPGRPAVAAVRKLFHKSGCDPTRYRPSSEALVRRLLRGEPMPRIHPLVDLGNCLSAKTLLPCCVLSEPELEPPFVFRSGTPGERYESLRGPFNLEGKPVLADARGPCDTPITGGERVKVRAGTSRAWLVVYLPLAVAPKVVEDELKRLLDAAPVALLRRTGCATSSSVQSSKEASS
jgi:DNA/RNA-binding domain of Phe-tRNA-synthetase-like protein